MSTRDPTGDLAARGLYITTASETNARVERVFPRGVASEDARERIGTVAPSPEDDRAPDLTRDVVIALEANSPIEVAEVRRALEPRPDADRSFVKGLTSGGAWEYVHHDNARGPYVTVTIQVEYLGLDAPVPAPQLERTIEWARSALGRLGGVPTASMSAARAIAKAKAAFRLKETLPDEDLDPGVVIVAPEGRRFPGRLVWDVAYSAGFRWGDGDYFHWLPSPDTDVSEGIGMGTTTPPGYFMPEWVAQDDGSADVDDLEMSFRLPRVWQPEELLAVMVRAARYMAERLGGTIVSRDGSDFDEERLRARVRATVAAMSAAGIVPASGIALRVF